MSLWVIGCCQMFKWLFESPRWWANSVKKKEKRLVLWDGASFFVPEILYFCWKHFLLPRLSLVSFSGIHSFQGFGEAALNLCFGPVFKVESGLPDCAHILRHYSKGQPWRVRLICRVPGVFFFFWGVDCAMRDFLVKHSSFLCVCICMYWSTYLSLSL